MGPKNPERADGAGGVIDTVRVGDRPYAVAVDPASGFVYEANLESHNVTVVDGATDRVVAWVPVGSLPDAIAVDTQDGYVYVANSGSDNVTVIDGSTDEPLASVPVGIDPTALAFDSANDFVYVANGGNYTGFAPDNVTVIDAATNRAVASITVGARPTAVAVDSANGRVFVANNNSGNLTVLDGTTDRAVDSVPAGSGPSGLAFDSWNGFLWVADDASTPHTPSQVTVVNGSSDNVVTRVPVGWGAVGITFDGGDGDVYVANSASDNVTAINVSLRQTVGSIAVGSYPLAAAYDSSNGYVYVANFKSGTLSVISPTFTPTPATFPVVFDETGLAQGTRWSVTLHGVTNTSNSSSIGFRMVNGTDYGFSIGTVVGYVPVPSGGTINVTGKPTTVTIQFFPVTYPLTFEETGLASGSNWSVTIVGTGSFAGSASNHSRTSSIGFRVPGGYTGTYSAVPPDGDTPNPASGTVYMPSGGGTVTKVIAFTTPPPAPSITSFNGTPASLTIGQSVTFHVVVSNGAKPLSYSYAGLPSGCGSHNAAILTCTPNATGNSTVTVTVSDGLHRRAEANATVAVIPATVTPTTNSTVLGLPGAEAYAVLGGIGVAAVALVLVIVWMRRRKAPPRSPSPGPPNA
jgi:YVTN family beta-propeller protein